MNEIVNKKCLSIDVVPASISITSSVKLVESHTFFLRNRQDITKKAPSPCKG